MGVPRLTSGHPAGAAEVLSVTLGAAARSAGQGFSIAALMSVLMVVAIAVSNGILRIDDANRRFQRRSRVEGGRRGRCVAHALSPPPS